MGRHMADLGQYAPAALAALARRRRHADADIGYIGKGEGGRGRRFETDRAGRGNAKLGQVYVADHFGEPFGDENFDRGLQTRPEPLGAAFEL